MILTDLWFLMIAAVLFLHLTLSGIDLGVCVLALFRPDDRAETMLSSIDSVWHANQTWLVVLGAMLFGAFPDVYGQALSSLYSLVILLLVALAVRGLGLEYRHHARNPALWRKMAGWGALAVLATEGLLLGALLFGTPSTTAGFGLASIVHPSFFPVMLLLFFCSLLMGGSWRLGILKRQKDQEASIVQRTTILAGGVGAILTGIMLCGRLLADLPTEQSAPWMSLIPLTVAGAAVSAILCASLGSRWKGSPLPWAMTLMGIIITGCAIFLRAGGGGTGESGGIDLSFLTIASAMLLPPLLAFQIFQYRLARRWDDPEQSNGTEN